MPNSHNHPSLLDLELHRTGEASPEIAAHVGGCAECQATVRQLGELPEKLFVPTAPPDGFNQAKEAAMFAFIRQRAGEIRKQRGRHGIRPLPMWVRIAAGITVAGALATLVYVSLPKTPDLHDGAALADDLNRDGKVDILDALALAQRTQGDRSPEVCRLATRIVAINDRGIR